MAGITVSDLIARGPERVREFMGQKHSRDEFDPRFSWLLLAETLSLEIGDADDAGDRVRAAQWAGIAADLYEQMLPGVKPEYEATRRIWTRTIASYRARVASVVTPNTNPVSPATDSTTPAGRSA